MSDSDAPRPRLCHLRKWPDFNGYGFNLHAERGKAGQFIGNVDPESPAVAANLRPGDRIVQVNGTNIGSENHQQVVQRIKAVPDETKLLVVDQDADNYYKEQGMVVPTDMYSVDVYEAPVTNPFTTPAPETEASLNAMTISDTGVDNDDNAAQIETAETAAAVEEYVAASYDYEARLCHLKMWSDFSGYGFNLHADRATPGQYVGKVDEGSPAEAAGLRLNDRIVEVNGHSVEGRSHAEVVADIKSLGGEVRLLVVDSDIDELCRHSGVILTSSCLTNIRTIICPDFNPYTSVAPVQLNGEEEVVTSTMSLPPTEPEEEYRTAHTAYEDDEDDDDYAAESAAVVVETMQHEEERTDEPLQLQQHSAVVETVPVAAVATSSVKPVAAPRQVQVDSPASATVNMGGPPAAASTVTVGGIEFAGSAKEARMRMKKKSNIKQDSNLSLRDKYELLQKL